MSDDLLGYRCPADEHYTCAHKVPMSDVCGACDASTGTTRCPTCLQGLPARSGPLILPGGEAP